MEGLISHDFRPETDQNGQPAVIGGRLPPSALHAASIPLELNILS
jgi:hypothetical protein